MRLPLRDLLDQSVQRHAHLPALLAADGYPLTYAQLGTALDTRRALLVAEGLAPDARIAVVLPNGIDAATAILTVMTTAVCIPLNPASRETELREQLRACRADAVVCAADDTGPIRALAQSMGLACVDLGPPGTDALRTWRAATAASAPAPRSHDDRSGDGPALLLQTSGTTGRPKRVPLTQANLAAAAQSIARHLELSPSDRALNMMPLHHVHGLVGSILATLASGGSVVCTAGFDAVAFDRWLADLRPTWYTAAPTIHQAILAARMERGQSGPCGLRFIRSASSAMSPRLIEALESRLGAPVIEAYGTTEASSPISSNPLPPRARKIGSVGLAAGTEIAIAAPDGRPVPTGEAGEILVRGAGVMAGYEVDADDTSDPDGDAERRLALVDGWFRTGDLGRFDDEGYLYVIGRLRERINRGGEKIAPREIDEALLELPGVRDAVAFAVPHPTLGEDIAAAVVMADGAAADADSLRLLLRTRLSDAKIPARFHFVATLPRNAAGKVNRADLPRWLAHSTHPTHSPIAGQRSLPTVGTPTEAWLAVAWCDTLQIGAVRPEDDFFTSGGDSLRAAILTGRINANFGLDLPGTTLFHDRTLAALAATIDSRRGSRAPLPADAALRDMIASLSDDAIAAMSDDEIERLLAESGETALHEAEGQ